ncbi:MAG: DUF4339 domain-containing protein [Ginsengibacter sp.]
MTHYFLKDGQTEIGPLTIEQLKCRPIDKNTPVWFAGLEEWTTLEEVYELKELVTPACSRSSKNIFVRLWNRFFKRNSGNNSYQMVVKKERNNLN